MNREELNNFWKKYSLDKDRDFHAHKHYTIITRSGIEKIAAQDKIEIHYDVIQCEPHFAAVKATGAVVDGSRAIQTFGSALYGKGHMNDKNKWEETGTTQSLYVLEIAEKRAFSRCVLQVVGLHNLDVKGEDESGDFKKEVTKSKKGTKAQNVALKGLPKK